MTLVSLEDMQRDLPGYWKKLAEGETLILLRENIPFAEVKPLPQKEKKRRPFGLAAGQFTVPDDFDTMFAEEIRKDFAGE